jgi:DNA-nicking Smr family endonuclease
MSAHGRRGPSDEDCALWARVTRSVKPLRKGAAPAADAGPVGPTPRKPPAAPAVRAPAARPLPKAEPSLAPLDRRLKQRLARGSQAIDDRIDLHGRTQSEAYAALLRFLRRAQHDGARFVLVITGKGGPARDAWSERGVLRRQVPQWLKLPEFRAYVVGFDAAHGGHGGEGALYVRIRKSKAGGQ